MLRHAATGRRRRWTLIGLTVVVFAAALLWWTGGLSTGGAPLSAAPPGSSAPSQPGPSYSPAAVPSSPQPVATSASRVSDAITGRLSLSLPVDPEPVLPGPRTVVLTVTSDAGIGAIGYKLRGTDVPSALKYYVPSPWTQSARVTGPIPSAALGVQVAPNGTWATCTITVDGIVRSTSTAHGAFHVTVCVA